jgi:hypothetical protein
MRVDHLKIFGKPTGAGTAVSLNNTDYGGLGDKIFLSSLGRQQCREHVPDSISSAVTNPSSPKKKKKMESSYWGYAPTRGSSFSVTVHGLLAGESYVFATAAYDVDGNLIGGHGIGPTTPTPIVALVPLPLTLCLSYLAQAAREHGSLQVAKKASTLVYDRFVQYYGRSSSPSSAPSSPSSSASNKEVDSDEEGSKKKKAEASFVTAHDAGSVTGKDHPVDPFGLTCLDLANPARAHFLLREILEKAPLPDIQAFVRATFVSLDCEEREGKGEGKPVVGHAVGTTTGSSHPDYAQYTSEALLPLQVAQMQCLQRLVCAVEVARMTVMDSLSPVVDPRRYVLLFFFWR